MPLTHESDVIKKYIENLSLSLEQYDSYATKMVALCSTTHSIHVKPWCLGCQPLFQHQQYPHHLTKVPWVFG